MTLRYHWENKTVNVECGNGICPHTRKVIQDVDYDYERTITTQDIIDYLMPYNLSKHNRNKTSEEVKETALANYYMKKALDFLIYGLSLSTELDELENDEYFVEFMKERYEGDALEEWEEYNDAY